MAGAKRSEIDNTPVVEYLFRKRMVRNAILKFRKIKGYEGMDLELAQDLEQDIYIILLRAKNQEKLVQMYLEGDKALQNYIFMTVRNNFLSTNSPYSRKYGKYEQNLDHNIKSDEDFENLLMEQDTNENRWRKF